jgi:hypothetical protein
MTENEKTEAEETYLNEHFGEGLLRVSPEQVHDFVESQATTGEGDPGSAHFLREHDYVKELNEEVGPEAIGKVAEEAFKHVSGIELGGPIPSIISGVLSMKSDQPDPEEERRKEAEREAEQAAEAKAKAEKEEWDRQHPGQYNAPDGSVGDATTQ